MRIRWSRDPDELPGPGEALARLWHTRVENLSLPEGGTTTRLAGYRMSVETADGRRLVAEVPGSDSDRDAPLVASDAPRDLVDLLNRAWMARLRPGRPSEQEARIAAIVDEATAAGPDGTRELVAHRLRRVDEWGGLTSDFKRDVRAAGGWQAIRKRAGF